MIKLVAKGQGGELLCGEIERLGELDGGNNDELHDIDRPAAARSSSLKQVAKRE